MVKTKSNPIKQPEWREVDPKVVIGAYADKVLKTIYQWTTKTVSQIAQGTGYDLPLVRKSLDYLIKQGRVRCIEKPPHTNEPVYLTIREERPGRTDCRDIIQVAAGVVWHCLGEYGRQTPDQIKHRTGLSLSYIAMATAWLAYEGRVRMFQHTRTKKQAYGLTAAQQKIYHKHPQYDGYSNPDSWLISIPNQSGDTY